ncbi:hypothetical protein NESM_000586000 [Novymonas esmeraldas]|uniref:Uncharacterized protein n=1 Tax=Novymonas esmeraldas TaxID=1808958 RepID=A0AAW0ERZ3_9TRYP
MRSRSGVASGGGGGATASVDALVRLDTSQLESRLGTLSDQWEVDLKSIRGQVGVCAVDLKSVAADVDAIQRFLLSYHNHEMSSVLLTNRAEVGSGAGGAGGAGGDPAAGEAAAAEQGPLDRFVATAAVGSGTENLLGMVAVARRLLAENDVLRASLDAATRTLSSHATGNAGLQGEVEQLRRQTTQQSALLRHITSWLGMPDVSLEDATDGGGGGGGAALMGGGTTTSSSPLAGQSTESVLSRSPLLLSFRQILLRDVTERLTSVVDQQSKDFHDAVVHLEDRLQGGGGHGGPNLVAAQATGVVAELQETVRLASKRLKDVDERTVKRDEFTHLMRTKADTLLLPGKADHAALTELEARLVARCADLEERFAVADAERTEFRALLRSLIAAQAQATAARPVASPRLSRGDALTSQEITDSPAAASRGATLGDLLPTLVGGTLGASPLSAHDSANTRQHGSPSPQQLYRVVGASHGSGVRGVALGPAAPKEASKSLGQLAAAPRDGVQANAAPSPSADGSVVAIGMTPTQTAYASYVSQQMTRRQVASLPALPYERLPSAH